MPPKLDPTKLKISCKQEILRCETEPCIENAEMVIYNLKQHYVILHHIKAALLSQEKKEHTKIWCGCAAASHPVNPELMVEYSALPG